MDFKKKSCEQNDDQISVNTTNTVNSNEIIVNLDETASSHAVNFLSEKKLAAYRVICLLWFTGELLAIFYNYGLIKGFQTNKYLTNEALFITWAYYLFMVLDNLVFNRRFINATNIFNYNILCIEI